MYLYTYSISVSDISDINSVNLKEDFGIKINAKKSSRKTITLAESLLKKSESELKEIRKYYDNILNKLKKQYKNTDSSDVKDIFKSIINKTQDIFDKLNSVSNNLLGNLKKEIDYSYKDVLHKIKETVDEADTEMNNLLNEAYSSTQDTLQEFNFNIFDIEEKIRKNSSTTSENVVKNFKEKINRTKNITIDKIINEIDKAQQQLDIVPVELEFDKNSDYDLKFDNKEGTNCNKKCEKIKGGNPFTIDKRKKKCLKKCQKKNTELLGFKSVNCRSKCQGISSKDKKKKCYEKCKKKNKSRECSTF